MLGRARLALLLGPRRGQRSACDRQGLRRGLGRSLRSVPRRSPCGTRASRPCACDACRICASLPMSSSFVARGQPAAPLPLPMHAAASPPRVTCASRRTSPKPHRHSSALVVVLVPWTYPHIRVCTACRQGFDDVRLPVDDVRLPPSTSSTPSAHARVHVVRTCRCCLSRARSVRVVTVHSRYVVHAIRTH
jgi:hypothetical protein